MKATVWRMQTYFDSLPAITNQLRGRTKEIWKSKILAVAGTTTEAKVPLQKECEDDVDITPEQYLTNLATDDVEKKFAFAGAYTSHSSASAADFLKRVIEVCPFQIDELQTDNGSEFALHFEAACATLGLTHFNTHPRSPKENPFVERFNRTISEDFIMLNRNLLRDDVSAFNLKLVDWLIWYNTIRPHQSLGMVSPLKYIVSTLTAEECQMWWTRTPY